jgi:hypothetical protein
LIIVKHTLIVALFIPFFQGQPVIVSAGKLMQKFDNIDGQEIAYFPDIKIIYPHLARLSPATVSMTIPAGI